MSKIDFKKELKHLYNPPAKAFTVVTVPAMQFLMVDGHGDPNVAQEYADALETLYAVAYKIKFASKNELDKDYSVPPLEGLWWAADMDTFTTSRDKSQWDWTMMIMQPDWITRDMF
ncbi:MAG: GyrI-like domain-containing protein, partial [Anaerolineales bacterium]|nr:GyrI-like domain-containing protein [Anaerolineales bacterium]